MKLKTILGYTLGALLIFSVYVLHKMDVSLAPLETPYIAEQPHVSKPPVILISYADGDATYLKNQNALSMSALNRGIDTIHMYRREHIDSVFYEQHKNILTQKRGAGYWLWKPYFILRTMESAPENAVIVYADSGVVLTQSLDPLLAHLSDVSRILVGHGKPVPLRHHAKVEAWSAILSGHTAQQREDILNQQNIWGFLIALKNTPDNRAYIKRWLVLCENAALLTDTPFESAAQESGFEFHQHDQSLLSLIDGQERVMNAQSLQSLIVPKDILRKRYGVYNYHRHPEASTHSPLLLMAGLPSWLNQLLWNNIVFTHILRRL